MQFETKRRSVLKAISWRTWATITTAIIVFVFTGEFALAITVGCFEVFAKMVLYFYHERIWQKISYGKKGIPSFVVWFTGLPASGKKSIADAVFEQLKTDQLKIERLASRDVRPLFPETGFSPPEVHLHITRAGHLVSMLEKNGVIVVASFVSPYRDSRVFARKVCHNFVEVYLKTTVAACEQRDEQGHYDKAKQGEYQHFPGVDIAYEEPVQPEVVIDVDQLSIKQASEQVVQYLKTTIINNN